MNRMIKGTPECFYFKPRGIPLSDLGEIELTKEEFEVIRLKDFEGLDQGEAANKMQISQPTFHRSLVSARNKIAKALIKGKAIKIEK